MVWLSKESNHLNAIGLYLDRINNEIQEMAILSSSEKSSKKSKQSNKSTKQIISKGMLTDVAHSFRGKVHVK